jgi:membrane protease YdiL (CAAX protease family)
MRPGRNRRLSARIGLDSGKLIQSLRMQLIGVADDRVSMVNGPGMRISFPAFVFLCYSIHHCVFIMKMALKKRMRKPPPVPVKKTYLPGIRMTALYAAFALLTALTSKIPVFGSSQMGRKPVLLGLAFLILELCLDPLEWKFTPDEIRKRIANFLPRTARERVFWVFRSVTTGVGEEIIYRAVLFGIIFQITGNYWIAAAFSAVVFALGHFSQGLIAVVDVFLVALVLQWLIRISGGLYVAIGVHFIHNLFNGILYGALIKPEPEGIRTEGETAGSIDADLAADQPADNLDAAASPAD